MKTLTRAEAVKAKADGEFIEYLWHRQPMNDWEPESTWLAALRRVGVIIKEGER